MEALASALEGLAKRAGVEIGDYQDSTTKEYAELQCKGLNDVEGELLGYNCELCKNKGQIAEPEQNDCGRWYPVYKQCKCMKTRKALKRLRESGLESIVKKCTFEAYTVEHEWQKSLKKLAMEYAQDSKGRWFFIGGNSGAGKTHLCTAIVRHFLLTGKNARYMVWMDESKKLKSSVTDTEMYEKMIAEIKNAEVLYIDDLFKPSKDGNGKFVPPTAADVQLVMEILNYRSINKMYATIISSERLLQEIIDIDEAVGGRIVEMTDNCRFAANIKRDRSRNYRLRNMTVL